MVTQTELWKLPERWQCNSNDGTQASNDGNAFGNYGTQTERCSNAFRTMVTQASNDGNASFERWKRKLRNMETQGLAYPTIFYA
ncbi:hypothetical protein AVEN_189829-1 [Araneus ventricosus]|uniref:Uncharacterized protein n=1 Tax=Araneus ventricosus TaxID=182803 RepID=A0A4Y2GGB4_ARAVE|nr:hypothetical protein AVEN_189829-1 [Araneus ventricosus]